MAYVSGYVIDADGFWVDTIAINLSLGEELEDNVIIEQPKGVFYKMKWDGSEWVEGMSQEEIDELKNTPIEPSEIEKLQEKMNLQGTALEELERQNTILKAQNQALTDQSEFHTDVLTEIILTITP